MARHRIFAGKWRSRRDVWWQDQRAWLRHGMTLAAAVYDGIRRVLLVRGASRVRHLTRITSCAVLRAARSSAESAIDAYRVHRA
jgi:hypothetical protein